MSNTVMTISESKEVLFSYTYADNNELDLSNTNRDHRLIRTNDLTTSGNPAGFIQWGQFYNSYRVHDIEMNVTFTNNSDTPVYVGIALFPFGLFTLPGGFSYNRFRQFPTNNFPNKQMLLSGKNGSNNSVKFSIQADCETLIGNSNQFDAQVNFSGNFITGPINFLTAAIYCLNNENVPAPLGTSITFSMLNKYHTTLFQQKLLIGA